MLKFALYLSTREDGNVIFHNELFSSFNVAKKEMDNFLLEITKKRSKKVIEIEKEEFEKLKISGKIEDAFYIRKKNSQILIYSRGILPGRIYNSYGLNKFGKIGINEFLIQTELETQKCVEESKITNLHVTNHERGNHVSLVSELKEVLARREARKIPVKITSQFTFDTSFVEDLIEGKKKLKKC
jgi:hypothetical protein